MSPPRPSAVSQLAERLPQLPSPADKPSPRNGLTSLFRLRCFQVVVEEAGFKRATGRLHVTQPALSYQMKQLEEEMGAQLFHRRPGGVTLTEAGRLLFSHVQRVSAAVHDARRAIEELPAAGEVRVGTVTSIGTYFLPQLLGSVRDRPGATRPTLHRVADECVDALLENRLDLAILAEPRVDKRLRYETLFEERVSLVSGRGHPLFGAPVVRPAELQGAQFVALSQETPTGALVHAYLDRLGISVEEVVSTENVESVKRMVEIGIGVAFLPDMVTERDLGGARPAAKLWRSAVEPALRRRIVLVSRDGVRPSPAVAAFVEELRRHGAAWAAAAARPAAPRPPRS